ncbi:hypothetical protein [Pseudodesulfovibrio sediminis]|uniref:N-acetyltransferase domain-containing protein n=1 Tax=Pseudodesulfovibrio sediminis TaxID=2810563 RepID=A0ABM7P7H1_9BACT|nr:hypothetical protein [Pseudodesulfovibrio sediminis]BCS88882.1 hypothetical protein PSDVSF_21240 [Pseudodesulfovibrio sediminis]
MAVHELAVRPETYAHFSARDRYRWLELRVGDTVYGHAAIAERGTVLELHLTLHCWGGTTLRRIREDLKWLKDEARRLGKTSIMGIRANGEEEFDPRLFKFARLCGFTETCIFQTATMPIA